jgi:hypothetical protein
MSGVPSGSIDPFLADDDVVMDEETGSKWPMNSTSCFQHQH